jgi:hypothetical protein
VDKLDRYGNNDSGGLNKAIKKLQAGGFDSFQPLILWKEQNTLLDGHSRLEEAKQAGIQHREAEVTLLSHRSNSVCRLFPFHREPDGKYRVRFPLQVYGAAYLGN